MATKIEGVNKGVCQWRATNNKPPYFVNYTEDGINKYLYYSIPSVMYSMYNRLISECK